MDFFPRATRGRGEGEEDESHKEVDEAEIGRAHV